uniref:Uncharacterized protein n=1 Tax=Amphimedon queenslandica TaxID=400682 RepID=A0A1X7T503_AMPQE
MLDFFTSDGNETSVAIFSKTSLTKEFLILMAFGDTSLGVGLLEDLVDTDEVTFLADVSPLAGVVPSGNFCLSGGLLLALFACNFSWYL